MGCATRCHVGSYEFGCSQTGRELHCTDVGSLLPVLSLAQLKNSSILLLAICKSFGWL